jgi:RES domain-containing protein
MLVYRITRSKYAEDLSGYGAKKNGGRWNKKGISVLYTSAHISLAFLELLVNADAFQLHDSYKIIQLKLNSKVKSNSLKIQDLPLGWRGINQIEALQNLGTRWLQNHESLVLEVPSAVLPYESNYLINPHHSDFHLVSIKEIIPLNIDERFLNSSR